jgi:hypothetical protein
MREVVVVSIPIDEASAKVRDGAPGDGEAAGSGPWVGIIPIQLAAGTPVPSSSVPPGVLPPAFDRLRRPRPD